MWSFGDLIENIPGMKPLHDVYRCFFGYLFWIAATARALRTP
jgi:hypothetical protein